MIFKIKQPVGYKFIWNRAIYTIPTVIHIIENEEVFEKFCKANSFVYEKIPEKQDVQKPQEEVKQEQVVETVEEPKQNTEVVNIEAMKKSEIIDYLTEKGVGNKEELQKLKKDELIEIAKDL